MNKLEYFWETNHRFEEFLRKLFPDSYKLKFSLEGNGIFNLLYIDNKIYELKYTQCKSKLQNDNRKITDKNKEMIINTIVENLKCDKDKITISGGKFITFPAAQWIAKVEIIKKIKEPT